MCAETQLSFQAGGDIIRVAALHEKSALKVKITELLLYLAHKMVSV